MRFRLKTRSQFGHKRSAAVFRLYASFQLIDLNPFLHFVHRDYLTKGLLFKVLLETKQVFRAQIRITWVGTSL